MSSSESESNMRVTTRKEKKKTSTQDLLNAVSCVHPSKLSSSSDAKETDGMEVYHIAGKKAAALVDPFGVPAKAFLTGLQHDRGGTLNSDSSLEDIERQLHFYNGTLKLLPGLKLELDTISPAKLTKVIQA
ncbi:hypothetical protein PAXINDRAFT_159417, partial [Paxillus involutus ATCC 200175]